MNPSTTHSLRILCTCATEAAPPDVVPPLPVLGTHFRLPGMQHAHNDKDTGYRQPRDTPLGDHVAKACSKNVACTGFKEQRAPAQSQRRRIRRQRLPTPVRTEDAAHAPLRGSRNATTSVVDATERMTPKNVPSTAREPERRASWYPKPSAKPEKMNKISCFSEKASRGSRRARPVRLLIHASVIEATVKKMKTVAAACKTSNRSDSKRTSREPTIGIAK